MKAVTVLPLSGVSMGYLAAERFVEWSVNGRVANLPVHSSFQHSLNLLPEDGHLLTLLSAAHYQNLPDAVRMTLPDTWDWRPLCSAGDTVQLSNGRLSARGWSLNLMEVPHWQPEITVVMDNNKKAGQQHYMALLAHLENYCRQHQINSAIQLIPGAGGHHKKIVNVSLTDNFQQLEKQISGLIGFGHGLTPDGDDYLVGYLAALWPWLSEQIVHHRILLTAAIEPLLGRTNDISRHYLNRALQGHFSEPLHRLTAWLYSTETLGTPNDVADEVMRFGASSGVDCLAGVLHGLRTLKQQN